MKISNIFHYISNLFSNGVLVLLSIVGSWLYWFFFPAPEYLYSSLAVLGMIVLDIVTRLYAQSRKAGGIKKAIRTKDDQGKKYINSKKFLEGTTDKLIIFVVMAILCSLFYRVSILSELAIWFTQLVYTLMLLKDTLSVFENLDDAGVKGLGIFRNVIHKKLDEYTGGNDDENN